MADQPDPERLQASREWKNLSHTLGVRTPRKLDEIARLARVIRGNRKGKGRKGR